MEFLITRLLKHSTFFPRTQQLKTMRIQQPWNLMRQQPRIAICLSLLSGLFSALLCKQSEGMVSWGCLSRNVGVGFCNHCLGEVRVVKTFGLFSEDSITESPEETTAMEPEETTAMEPEETTAMEPEEATTEESDLSFFADWPLFCTALWYPYDSEKCKSARCMPCAESIRST